MTRGSVLPVTQLHCTCGLRSHSFFISLVQTEPIIESAGDIYANIAVFLIDRLLLC